MYPYNLSCCESFAVKNKEMITKVGSNIRKIRLSRRMTQEGLAEKAEINPKYLGELERGEKNGTILIISRISQALSVPICEIFSKRHCFLKREQLIEDVSRLLEGKNDQEVKKAIRILAILFE